MFGFKHMLDTGPKNIENIVVKLESLLLPLKNALLANRLLKLSVSLFVLYLYRGRRQRPVLCSVLLSAAHVGPSLSQPHRLSEFGAEGLGDGWPSLLGQMQPLKEE